MNKTITSSSVSKKLNDIHVNIQSVTSDLFNLASDDVLWWKENITQLINQPFVQIKLKLRQFNDQSLNLWEFEVFENGFEVELDSMELLVWLVSLCRVDKLLTNVLPPRFTEHVDLYWRIYANYWLTE